MNKIQFDRANKKCLVQDDGRVCTICHDFKLWSEFNPMKLGINKKRPECKTCQSGINWQCQLSNKIKNGAKNIKQCLGCFLLFTVTKNNKEFCKACRREEK